MRDTILYDSALRLFGDHVTPKVLEAAEAGEWPEALWRAVDEAGYLDVLADGTGGMVEAVAILRAAGHHAAPIPLPETMLARFLCALSGIEAPAGPLSIALVEPGEAERYPPVPWGRAAEAMVLVSASSLSWCLAAICASRPDQPCRRGVMCWLASERRAPPSAGPGRGLPLPNALSTELVRGVGALLRAAQMAGAMEAALGLATTYANDRVQFGRPIGKFQAIQQQLALLAEEAAAALVAVESAAISSPRGGNRPNSRCRRENPGRRGGRRGRRDRASGARRDRLHRGTLLAQPDPAAVVVARRVPATSSIGQVCSAGASRLRAAPGYGR